jgi:3-oxoacyl-[acyl-carrier protein] reductase
MGAYGPFLELAPEHLEEMIDLNLKGTLYTAAATLPHLIAAGGGDFVSLASVAGLRAFPGEAVYNASKFGQLGFTRALDHELREHGIRATNVCPGGVATDFAMGTGREEGSTEGMMSAEEVADVVLFCVTRPRDMRMLTVSYRPMIEGSWG